MGLSWGVDGYGRAHIIDNNNQVIFCMIDGCGKLGVMILEEQQK